MKKYRLASVMIALVLIIAASTGCDKQVLSNSDTLVLTVDDSRVYLDELMYHVMLTEMQGQLYASFLNDTDFWNKEYKDGVTMGEVMKEETMDNAIKYELLYQMANENGYSLSEEERNDCQSKVDNILLNIPEDQIDSMGLTKDKLLSIQEKIALSSKYYEENYKNQGIDDEAAYEQMKEGHSIQIEKKVWNKVELGELKK